MPPSPHLAQIFCPVVPFTHVKRSQLSKLPQNMLNKPALSQNWGVHSEPCSLTGNCHERSTLRVFALLSRCEVTPAGFSHRVAWGKGPFSRRRVHVLAAHPKCQLPDAEGCSWCSASPAGKRLCLQTPSTGRVLRKGQQRSGAGGRLGDRFPNESSAVGEAVFLRHGLDEGAASAPRTSGRGDPHSRS